MKSDKAAERTIVSFDDPTAFEAWLAEHHTQPTGVWLQINKKGAGPSVTYAQALDAALCWGWIDGQKSKHDETSWLQYFCPRRKGSVWSQVNQGHVARLSAEGRMRPPGQAVIDEAKRSGQWDLAYQPTRSQDVPPALALALDQNPQAKAFFDGLDRQNRFAFIFRCTTPKKEETRQRKVEEFVRMLEAGEVFYPKSQTPPRPMPYSGGMDTTELLTILQQRFTKNPKRHADLDWTTVQTRLEAAPAQLARLGEMERTGGEPDVIGTTPAGELIFCDCSAESPAGRRSLCYDRQALDARKENKPSGSAVEMAAAMGLELLNEDQYRDLQELGEFDKKTSSWVRTTNGVRSLGGALFCDRRYDRVFVYHNGADSYYGARGFRGLLKV